MAVAVEEVRLRTFVRLDSLTAVHAVVILISASFALRFGLALAQATPYIFPDEYIYWSLSRELAESGRPLIRDEASFFPAFFASLVVAPFQLLDDVAASYRSTQAAYAFSMSLAAVPAFALSRRIGLANAPAVAVAALAVAVPDLVYASFMLAEPIAYPLALTALYAGVRALERPTWRAQLVFLLAAALATATRLQYAAIFVAFFAAAALIERRALRLPMVCLAVAAAGVLGAGPTRVLGPYSGLFGWDPTVELAQWAATNLLLLTWATGAALVPAALVGLALSLTRPRNRAELAFGVLTTVFAALLVLEAAMIADFDSGRFEERYLFILMPLLAIGAALWIGHERKWRGAVIVGAALTLVLALRIPVSSFVVATGEVDSPFLWSVARLARVVGIETASLIAMSAVALAAVLGIAASFMRRPLAVIVATTLVGSAAVSAGAHAYAIQNAGLIRAADLPRDPRWIDHAGVENVALLHTPDGARRGAMEHLFWNRSVEDVLVLGGATGLDAFGAGVVRVGRDGTLVSDGRALARPLLIQTYALTVDLHNAERIGRGGTFELWLPEHQARLELLMAGRYHDGWLAPVASVFVWPARGRLRGTLRVPLAMPAETQNVPVEVTAPGSARTVVVRSGERRTLEIPLDSCDPVSVRLRARVEGHLSDSRAVGVRAGRPVFTPAQAGTEPCR